MPRAPGADLPVPRHSASTIVTAPASSNPGTLTMPDPSSAPRPKRSPPAPPCLTVRQRSGLGHAAIHLPCAGNTWEMSRSEVPPASVCLPRSVPGSSRSIHRRRRPADQPPPPGPSPRSAPVPFSRSRLAPPVRLPPAPSAAGSPAGKVRPNVPASFGPAGNAPLAILLAGAMPSRRRPRDATWRWQSRRRRSRPAPARRRAPGPPSPSSAPIRRDGWRAASAPGGPRGSRLDRRDRRPALGRGIAQRSRVRAAQR